MICLYKFHSIVVKKVSPKPNYLSSNRSFASMILSKLLIPMGKIILLNYLGG